MESVATTWLIELFGRPRAVCGKKSVSDFRTQHCGLLLAILAARPERVHTREELRELLWPDEDRQLQQQRFRDVLSKLKGDLGEEVFEKSGNFGVRVRPGITSDVAHFDHYLLTAVRASTPEQRLPILQAAAALYKDDLLPGFYDDWSVRERERLKAGCFDVLTRLALDFATVGRTDEAQTLRRELASRFPEQALPPTPLSPSDEGVLGKGLDGYYGREADVLAVRQWTGRLLTLTGPGGMGKTRLSRQALPQALFVPLAEVSDAKSGFFTAIHTALSLPKGDASPREQVVYALNQKEAPLLVLDNFEQIVAHGAPLVADLLKDVPKLRCLVTSRRRLGIRGEVERTLEPLPHAPSVALFLDRARRARPDFAQNPSALPTVEEIVALLEGLPLAIELAAARSVVLGPLQMRDQLSGRLRFLVNRRHATSERHRSLRAALDWSIHLLSPDLKRIFARLSVFRGGWSLEAAQTVCQGCGMEVLDALDELHSHSLITVTFDQETETPRYDMLVVIREYAEEVLAEISEEKELTLGHYKKYYLDLADSLIKEEDHDREFSNYKILDVEKSNILFFIQLMKENFDIENIISIFNRLGAIFLENGNLDIFHELDVVIDIEKIHDDDLLWDILGLKAASARRGDNQDIASEYWLKRFSIAYEKENYDDAVGVLFELAGTSIDLKDDKKAKQYLNKSWDIICRENLEYRKFWWNILQSRLLCLQNKQKEASEWAELTIEMAYEFRGTYRWLAIAYYIAPVLRESGNLNTAMILLREGMTFAAQHSHRYVLARMCEEAVLEYYEMNEIDKSKEIHCFLIYLHHQIGSKVRTDFSKYPHLGVDNGNSFSYRMSRFPKYTWENVVVYLRNIGLILNSNNISEGIEGAGT